MAADKKSKGIQAEIDRVKAEAEAKIKRLKEMDARMKREGPAMMCLAAAALEILKDRPEMQARFFAMASQKVKGGPRALVMFKEQWADWGFVEQAPPPPAKPAAISAPSIGTGQA